MNNIDLSIILPSIRTTNLVNVYQSILESCTRSFELIVVGPYPLPKELENKSDVLYIKSYRSPNAAQQQGSVNATAKYIVWTADDGLFIKNGIDEALDILESIGKNEKNIVCAKYSEGGNSQPDNYFHMKNAYFPSLYFEQEWWIFNLAFMYRSYFNYLGGWDTLSFECCPFAHCDLGARSYFDGANVKMFSKDILHCDHYPNTTFDHAPVHYGQGDNDVPTFAKIYSDPSCKNRKISMDNWKLSPQIWNRRFKQ